jgi:alkylation response protein AidB-like acyl-CoA dehydrogenase
VDYHFTEEENTLRAELRDSISNLMPADYPGIVTEDPRDLEASWSFARAFGADGVLTRSWPREFGGAEASLWSQVVFNEEMWGHNEPRGGQYMGVTWIGPALMMFGSVEQQQQHLPPIAAGDVQWCQGFSEPDAGSDLASLRTAARKVEGGYRVTGQKIWTSYANIASWCVLATRTSSDGPKQHGITVFLVPMDREGITVRPIDSLLGPNHFNEVFLDDVFVADDEVLGTPDEGWKVMSAGLAYERVGIPRYARSDQIIADVERLTAEQRDDSASADLAATKVHTFVARLLAYRVITEREQEQAPSPAGGIARIVSTQLDQEVADLALDLVGTPAFATHHEATDPQLSHLEHHWRYAQASTVAAGSLEIQKMLVARQTL